MSETKVVDLTILNRSYKVKVETKNETIVQLRMKEIQEKLSTLKINFPGRDVQDYLSMALIDAVSSGLQSEDIQTQQQEMFTQLQKLNEMLD